jgi:hypothetical protein
VQVHLYLLIVDHVDTFQDAPHGSAGQAGTAARLLLPGLEAELDVCSREWLAVMELHARPDRQRHDVASVIRLPVSDEALCAQLSLIVSSDERVIHITDIGEHGG